MSFACDTCPVRDRAACSVLDESERQALAAAGRIRDIGRGDILFHAGDEMTACATLISGALKVTSIDPDGEERILALVHPSGFIGEMFQPFAQFDVVALTDSKLCTFSRANMDGAIERFPSLARALLRRSQEDLHRAHLLLQLTGKHSANEKVGSLLLAMAQAASDSPCHPAALFDLPLSRGEMANMLGLTIETVSRQLSRLEKSGIIRREGARGIALLDPARLRLSGISPAVGPIVSH
ncbi:helix-turn-helix domain-containing protein [Altererythrobacter confluentis]|uniref:Helix-turn-helix domain-containing protein n=1 Tax=Allopontixanthobacter confluentis TaxID=1849021 RepID=A0A6L7GCM2_9SPHN|nr:Crp/Fnr family transcriptional regulator [Allopontixanthobacter confluentis]MXP13723.1 helix-turn-helix domain-containing protein [Allopontixanthobacter confluentis]